MITITYMLYYIYTHTYKYGLYCFFVRVVCLSCRCGKDVVADVVHPAHGVESHDHMWLDSMHSVSMLPIRNKPDSEGSTLSSTNLEAEKEHVLYHFEHIGI